MELVHDSFDHLKKFFIQVVRFICISHMPDAISQGQLLMDVINQLTLCIIFSVTKNFLKAMPMSINPKAK